MYPVCTLELPNFPFEFYLFVLSGAQRRIKAYGIAMFRASLLSSLSMSGLAGNWASLHRAYSN